MKLNGNVIQTDDKFLLAFINSNGELDLGNGYNSENKECTVTFIKSTDSYNNLISSLTLPTNTYFSSSLDASIHNSLFTVAPSTTLLDHLFNGAHDQETLLFIVRTNSEFTEFSVIQTIQGIDAYKSWLDIYPTPEDD